MVGLEHEAEVVRTLHAAGRRLQKSAEDVEKRRLARSGTSDYRHLLALFDGEADALQDLDGLLPGDAEALGDG